MAVRKSIEETFVVDGPRDEWLRRVRQALENGRFTSIEVSETLYQARANFKKFTVWGEIKVTLLPEREGSTKLTARATANVDNIFALFRSPGRAILERFKANL